MASPSSSPKTPRKDVKRKVTSTGKTGKKITKKTKLPDIPEKELNKRRVLRVRGKRASAEKLFSLE